MSLPILPDVLAYNVCPFLGNRERSNMLQLSRDVRCDLIKRDVASHVRYRILQGGDNAEIIAKFNFMQRIGTRGLLLRYSEDAQVSRVNVLDKLCELRIYTDDNAFITNISSSNLPASLQSLHIEDIRINGRIIINLDHLPHLNFVDINAAYSTVTIVAPTTPQYLSRLKVCAESLDINRENAARILAAPAFHELELSIFHNTNTINSVFDGLDAPELTRFASSGSLHELHNYDLLAPKLRSVKHNIYGCIPKSAPNIMCLATTAGNPNQYAHLATLTHLDIVMYSGESITALPPNLTELTVTVNVNSRVIYFEYLPPHLVKLHIISNANTGGRVQLPCALPSTLKEIELQGVRDINCKLSDYCR
jgi:hypothetical protein